MNEQLNITENFEKLKPNLYAVETRVGPMAVYKNDNLISLSLAVFGEYSHAEVMIMNRYLNEDSVYLDIGTNVGYHALAIGKMAKCKVLGFEPHPNHFTVAAYNCQNDPVKLFNAAVGKTDGTVRIDTFDPAENKNYGEVKIDENCTDGVEVQLMKIDSLKLDNCTLMKIDTEGQELNVLKGAAKTLKKFRPVIFYEAIGDKDWPKVYDHLEKLGYKQYWVGVRVKPTLHEPLRPLAEGIENPFGAIGVSNILAVPEEHQKQPEDLVPVNGHEPFNDTVGRLMKYKLIF